MKKNLLLMLILTFSLCFMLSACGNVDGTKSSAGLEPEMLEPENRMPAFSVLPGVPVQGNGDIPTSGKPDGEIPEETETEDMREIFIRTLLDTMTDKQLAGQMVMCACPVQDATELIRSAAPAGLILFNKNIDGKTGKILSQELRGYQEIAQLPLLIAVDEEGGTVARVSANPAIRESRFRSPRRILAEDGLEGLRAEMTEKAQLLLSLGIHINLAPVCDVAADENSFMYARALPGTVDEICTYVGEMVTVMQNEGLGTVLKHFPGYGENGDTHTTSVTDDRPQETFFSVDFLPFQAGITAGSRGILVSHNIVTAFDAQMPASLSKTMIDVLRLNLGQDLVVMTDDLQMDAISGRWTLGEAVVLAIEAGEDLVLCSDGATAAAALAQAITDERISRERAEESVRRILLWKMELGLLVME